MTSDSIIAITLLTASALTSGFFAYMHSLRRQAYLMLWSAGWCLLALHYLSPALAPWIAVAPWQQAVNEWLLAAAALLFFSTARVYTQAEPWVRPQIAAGAIFVLWSVAYYLHNVSVPPQLGVAVVLEDEHMCMRMRGVEKQNSIVMTSAMLGVFRKNHETRQEFMNLIRKAN